MTLLRPIEVFLLTTLLFLTIWLLDDYLATWLTLVFGAISVGVLVVAGISEWLEPSRVPRQFFLSLGAFLFALLLVGGGYLLLVGGTLAWVG